MKMLIKGVEAHLKNNKLEKLEKLERSGVTTIHRGRKIDLEVDLEEDPKKALKFLKKIFNIIFE